eukprot:810425_1
MMSTTIATIVSICIAFNSRFTIAGDTCCYNPQCPAAQFVKTSSSIDGFSYTAEANQITEGSFMETIFSISVSSCCPDGGWVYTSSVDTTLDKMCRCGDADNYLAQTSCIASGYTGCAPTSSPTAEICPDFSAYEVPGNSYSVGTGGVAYCNIGEDFLSSPVMSSEQRCDIENTICLEGMSAAWDGTFTRTVSDVSYAWPQYFKEDDTTKNIKRGLDTGVGYSRWVGVNDGTGEWGSVYLTTCGSSPFAYNIVGSDCELSTAGNIVGFPSATITSGACMEPTESPTKRPSRSPTTAYPTDVPSKASTPLPTEDPTSWVISDSPTSDPTEDAGTSSSASVLAMKWIFIVQLLLFLSLLFNY